MDKPNNLGANWQQLRKPRLPEGEGMEGMAAPAGETRKTKEKVMDFNLTVDQELLLESIDEFAERYFDEETVNAMYDNHGIPDEIGEAYRDAGFAFMGLPEEVGGIPCDKLTLGLMTERLYHATGCMTPFMTAMLAVADVAEFGTPEQAELIVEQYNKSGRPVASLALSEPGAGSDNKAMSTYTKRQEDGTYILNGQKTWVTNGGNTPYMLIIAKDEHPAHANESMSLWLVPTDIEGLSTAPLEKIGQQIIPFVDVFFDEVRLTEDMRIGKEGEGFLLLMKNFEIERCLVVAQSLGLAQACMDDAAAYANERYAFGKPIGWNPMIQDMLAEMETILENSRNMLYKTLWQLDQGQSVRVEAALLKRYATVGCTKVADMALEIFAALGYTTASRVGRIWTDLRGNQLAGGTVEIMSYIAGRQILKNYAK